MFFQVIIFRRCFEMKSDKNIMNEMKLTKDFDAKIEIKVW